MCLWWLRCCDIKVDKRDYTRNTHAYSVQLLGSPEGKRLKPISPHWHLGRLIYISRSVLEVTKSSHFLSKRKKKKCHFTVSISKFQAKLYVTHRNAHPKLHCLHQALCHLNTLSFLFTTRQSFRLQFGCIFHPCRL